MRYPSVALKALFGSEVEEAAINTTVVSLSKYGKLCPSDCRPNTCIAGGENAGLEPHPTAVYLV